MTTSSTQNDLVAVIGLGRFGGQAALTLAKLGQQVLGIDRDVSTVSRFTDQLPRVVQADATDETALRRLGVADLHHAVVGIGAERTDSMLTVLALVDLGVRDIWAKAVTRRHGQVLASIGARHVVYPQRWAGQRVAHRIGGKLLGVLDIDDGWVIARTRIPAEAAGRSLADSELGARHGVTVIAVKRVGDAPVDARPDTVLHADDHLVMAGRMQDVERFAATT